MSETRSEKLTGWVVSLVLFAGLGFAAATSWWSFTETDLIAQFRLRLDASQVDPYEAYCVGVVDALIASGQVTTVADRDQLTANCVAFVVTGPIVESELARGPVLPEVTR